MEIKHLSREEWLKLLEPHLSRVSPATREALLSGNTKFTVDGVTYSTNSLGPVRATHHTTARVDSITSNARKEYVQ